MSANRAAKFLVKGIERDSSLKFIIFNNLKEIMAKTKKLLKILMTTPMTIVEAERHFSILNRLKTVVRNLISKDCLSASLIL